MKKSDKDKLEKVYFSSNKSVFTYYKFGNILVPQSAQIYFESDIEKIKGITKHETKEDAMYCILLNNLIDGGKLSNFKKSKYYEYYIKRLKIENPEYLI